MYSIRPKKRKKNVWETKRNKKQIKKIHFVMNPFLLLSQILMTLISAILLVSELKLLFFDNIFKFRNSP